MTISATLTQQKLYSPEDVERGRPERFLVRTQVTDPIPATVLNLPSPMVMQKLVPGLDREGFLRVARAGDLTAYTVNRLRWFQDAVIEIRNLSSPGYRLVLSDPLGEYVTETEFFIDVDASPSAFKVPVTVPAWYSNATPLTWQVFEPVGPEPVAVGNNGFFLREDDTLITWLDDRCMAQFGTAQEALDHMTSVQANFQSLLTQLTFTPEEFYDYPPGNPVVHSYVG
jgi:hypothetical protein